MRRWAVLPGLALALAPSVAPACGNLNAYGRRLEAEREARFLWATRTVEGRWHGDARDANAYDDGYRSGTILLMRGGRETGRSLDAAGTYEINCGFPHFPEDGDTGRFYLRREHGFWNIVHFVPRADLASSSHQERMQ